MSVDSWHRRLGMALKLCCSVKPSLTAINQQRNLVHSRPVERYRHDVILSWLAKFTFLMPAVMPLPIPTDCPDDSALQEKLMTINVVQIVRVRHSSAFWSVMAAAIGVLIAASITGCKKETARTPSPRPVRTVTIDTRADGETLSFTGQIRAKDQVNLAFRIDGRMIEREPAVGDVIAAGQVVATLDSQHEQNSLRAAQANLAAAQATLTQARLSFGRQHELVKNGWTPRAKFEEAEEALHTSEAQVESAKAQLRIAQDQLGYTVLRADNAGVVTSTGADAGEVVRAGQMIVQLAGTTKLDAVFDVPEQVVRSGPRDPVVELALSDDPQVHATGYVRVIAPQADSATRTFQVKVGINNPPEGMKLGATVTGRIKLHAPEGVTLPASALTQGDSHPAVWVVDRQTETVLLRPVDVMRYDPASIVISHGLEKGDVVVTAGGQMLRPGQKVRLLGDG
jgi:RND family efflux transporter MFP subunit